MKNEETVVSGPGAAEVAYWEAQITAAKKREENFRKRGEKALEIYQLEQTKVDGNDSTPETPFNILFSNTETLLPALYNEKPRPVIRRRFEDPNPAARWGAEALTRGIDYQMDNPSGGYENLHPMLENAVLSALVPGRGVTRFGYDADITEYDEKKDTEDDDALADGDIDGEVPPGTEDANESPEDGDQLAVPGVAPAPQVKNEAVCASIVEWDSILYGYAKRWDKVPWVAFEWKMTKKDVEKAFGESWAEKLTYASAESEDSNQTQKDQDKRPEETARIWEIWHKTNRQVIYYAECYEDGIIKRLDDPLGLSGFFPIPEPLTIFLRVTGLVPVPIYDTYRRQARELNRLTVRIEKITEAVKVRGFYNSSIGALEDVFTAGDNVLLPANGAALMEPGNNSLDKAIWVMPLEVLVNTLRELTQQRDIVKQTIYEITGISDILRGSSQPSETATAQNIKNQWGTLRLKKVQKRVQRYVRDCFRIMAEIMAEHFSEETFKEMTGLPLLLSTEKEQLQAKFQGLQQQQQQQQAAQQAQQPPVNGQSGGTAAGAPSGTPSPAGPPPAGGTPPAAGGSTPQPPDPLSASLAQMQDQLSKPSWGEVLGLLKDQLQRGYSIDVETDSTVDPEAVEDRQQMGEVIQAFGQAMGQLLPFVQQGILPLAVAKAMMKDIVKKFRFSDNVEDAIDKMPDQLPPQGPPESVQVAQIKAAAEQQKTAAAQQGDPAVTQAESQAKMQEIQGKMALLDKELEVKQRELEMKNEELNLAQQELDLKKQEFQVKSQGALEAAHANRRVQQINSEGKIAAAQAKTQAAMMAGMQPQMPMQQSLPGM